MLIVIGADTMVVLDGKIFGKPRSASDGKHMLRQLSGRTHEVITAVSVWMAVSYTHLHGRGAPGRGLHG